MKHLAYVLAAITATLCAQPPQPPPHPPVDAVKSYLNLTDQQLQTLDQLHQSERAALQPVHDQMRQAQQDLRAASDSQDMAVIGTAQAKIAALRKQLDQAHAQSQTTATAALTADQKAKLSALNDLSKMMPVVREAAQLGLLTPPPPPDGPAGPPPRPDGPPPPPFEQE